MSIPTPSEPLETVYATDEDVAVRAAGDFAVLTPDWQKLAAGVDGYFSVGSRWTLSSPTVDFEAAGVSVGHIASLKKGTFAGSDRPLFAGEGELFAVAASSGSSLTLRRIGRPAGSGQPPGPTSGATAVHFTIATLAPQIEEASFALNRELSIGDGTCERGVADLHDLRDLRAACVMRVLYDRYCSETRSDRGDFALKIRQYREDLEALMARLRVRWKDAPTQTASGWYFGRVTR